MSKLSKAEIKPIMAVPNQIMLTVGFEVRKQRVLPGGYVLFVRIFTHAKIRIPSVCVMQ